MSSLPTDAFPDFPDPQPAAASHLSEAEIAASAAKEAAPLNSSNHAADHAADPPAAAARSDRSHSSMLFYVRAARQQDLTPLAEILTSSFHSPTGTMGWLYPLLRQGIYEDMRLRLRSNQAHYVCLVAARRMSAQEAVFESRVLESPRLAAVGSDSPLGELQSNRLVGTVEISRKTGSPFLRRSPYLYLSNLAVLEAYRQQGVAQQLLRVCERVALDWGYQDLYLHVLEDNARARRLYSKAGYQVERIETSITSALLGRSRQMFLHKSIARS